MAVLFDAASTANGEAITSLSWTHTPVGTPTAVGVGISWWSGSDAISTITYGGAAMTLEASDVDAIEGPRASIYGKANPAPGAQTISISWGAASVYPVGGALTVTGSDTSDTFSNNATANGNEVTPNATASATTTSATNELVMDTVVCMHSTGTSTITVGAGQTQRWNASAGTAVNLKGGGSTEVGAASVTMSWTVTNTENVYGWAIVAASFRLAAPAATDGTGSGNRRIYLPFGKH